jgi:hypothetical protein
MFQLVNLLPQVVYHTLFHITSTPAGDVRSYFSDLTVECVSP